MGSDTKRADDHFADAEFQFTLPRGERPGAFLDEIKATVFQFTLPRGERQLVVCGVVIVGAFQFTLPRGERRGGGALPRP